MAAELKVPGPLRRDKRSSENAVSADPVSIPVRRDARICDGVDADSGDDSTKLFQVPLPPSSPSTAIARDPVCGQQVEPNNSLKAVFNDKPYYFCHANCKNQFDQDPQRYTRTRSDNRSPSNSSENPNRPAPAGIVV
jgi:YHS domain-containing protein